MANSDIYRIPDNTQSKVEQLTLTPSIPEYNPLVSRDGKKVVFDTGGTGLTEPSTELALETPRHIYVLDTASRKLEDITSIFTSPPIVMPPMTIEDWSPDGRQFALINYQMGLEIMNFDGTNRKDIPMPSVGVNPYTGLVKWSPDGEKLVMNYSMNVNQLDAQLLVYDLGSAKLTLLADYGENCLVGIWSSTSQQVAATCYLTPPDESTNFDPSQVPSTVRIFDVENPNQSYGHPPFSICSDPSWSPDGKLLAFMCEKDKNHKGIFVEDSTGKNIHEVDLGSLDNPAILRNPTWSPDGTQIIYVAGADKKDTNIYSVHLDVSDNHLLTNQEADYSIVSVYPTP